jgi:hypothetical protein
MFFELLAISIWCHIAQLDPTLARLILDQMIE